MDSEFKNDNSFEKRSTLSQKIKSTYPDRIPVIVGPAPTTGNSNTILLTKQKYLAPSDITVGKFLLEIRKHTELNSREAIFLFCDNGGRGVLVPTAKLMTEIYDQYHDADGFLYLYCALENTFGWIAWAENCFYDMMGVLSTPFN